MGHRLPGELDDRPILRRGPRDAVVLLEVVAISDGDGAKDVRRVRLARLRSHRWVEAVLVVQPRILRLHVRGKQSFEERRPAAREVEDEDRVLGLGRAELPCSVACSFSRQRTVKGLKAVWCDPTRIRVGLSWVPGKRPSKAC